MNQLFVIYIYFAKIYPCAIIAIIQDSRHKQQQIIPVLIDTLIDRCEASSAMITIAKPFIAVVIINIVCVNGMELFAMYTITEMTIVVLILSIMIRTIYPCTAGGLLIILKVNEFIELFQQITTKPFIAEMVTTIVYVNGKVLKPFIAIKINVAAVYVNGQDLLLTNTTIHKCRMKLNYDVHSAL